MAKLLFIDCETTGLEPSAGAVMLSIAAIASDGEGNEQHFEAMVLPTDEQWQAASPEALAVNGITWADLESNGRSVDLVDQEFAAWLAELGPSYRHVGQNPMFDRKFIVACLPESGRSTIFDVDPLDCRKMYDWVRSMPGGKHLQRLDRRSGKAISLALGVEPESDVHTAMGGAQVVQRNYKEMRRLVYGE